MKSLVLLINYCTIKINCIILILREPTLKYFFIYERIIRNAEFNMNSMEYCTVHQAFLKYLCRCRL